MSIDKTHTAEYAERALLEHILEKCKNYACFTLKFEGENIYIPSEIFNQKEIKQRIKTLTKIITE